MSEWIDAEIEQPTSFRRVVFVTDGIITCLAKYINDPKEYYGEELMEWDKKWHDPHWLIINIVGPFKENDEFSGIIDDITHWMPLPKPPDKNES